MMLSARSLVRSSAFRSYARGFASVARPAVARNSYAIGLAAAATAAVVFTTATPRTGLAARLPASGDVISMGKPVIESATGIAFPQLCNGLYFTGCGVRIKYMFVKVYAVGTYMDPLAMSSIKSGTTEQIEQALLDPTYPRCFRIVMNRDLTIKQYTDAILEAVKPRMKGRDDEVLDEFIKLNGTADLVKGAEIEMTVRGDSMLLKNGMGAVGTLRSRAFCEALCDVYFGADPVSVPHKEAVIEGVRKL